MRKNQKVCKIISELSYFLLEEYSDDVKINVETSKDNDVITFTIGECSEEDILFLKDNIKAYRNETLEEYAWELMGENDGEYDLKLLGSLVDEVVIEEVDNHTIIKMIRYNGEV